MKQQRSSPATALAIIACIAFPAVFSRVRAAGEKQPDWVASLGTSARYPEARYFTGFGVSNPAGQTSVGPAIDQAKSSAASALAEGMRVRVQVKVTSGTTANSQTSASGKSRDVRDDYWSQIVSTSDIDVEGLGFEVFQLSAGQPVYALAWIDKDQLRKNYHRKLASRMQLADELNKRVDQLSAQGDMLGAQELSGESQNVLDQIDGITVLLELLGETPDAKALASEKADILRRIPDPSAARNGPLRLALWTSLGGGSVTLLSGEAMAVFAHVNKPCYLHLICRLSVGAWVVPDRRYWNLKLDETKAGRDYILPDSFFAARPPGIDTLVAIVSEEKWPACEPLRRSIAGQDYLVVMHSCVPSRVSLLHDTPDSASARSILVTTIR